MEMAEPGGGTRYEFAHWGWALGSAAQLGWGILSIRRGYTGDGGLMPLKAFGVASLFVGSAAAAVMATLRASGIHTVDDMRELGENIRTSIGAPPRDYTK